VTIVSIHCLPLSATHCKSLVSRYDSTSCRPSGFAELKGSPQHQEQLSPTIAAFRRSDGHAAGLPPISCERQESPPSRRWRLHGADGTLDDRDADGRDADGRDADGRDADGNDAGREWKECREGRRRKAQSSSPSPGSSAVTGGFATAQSRGSTRSAPPLYPAPSHCGEGADTHCKSLVAVAAGGGGTADNRIGGANGNDAGKEKSTNCKEGTHTHCARVWYD
jgi:hypothetical protein